LAFYIRPSYGIQEEAAGYMRRDTAMAREVWVNREECISCGLCVSLAPEVFRFEDGKSIAYKPSGAPEQRIQECIDNCPVSAISWREEE
jgi:ferredoxin